MRGGLFLSLLAASAVASPLVFEQNLGQHDARAQLFARARGAAVFLTEAGPVFSLHRGATQTAFRLDLRGSISAFEPLAERHHYFVGAPERWKTNVPTFARARYASAWPGIDVELHGDHGALELDLRLAPHADVSAARLAFTGATVRMVRPDSIELDVAGQRVRLDAPVARQGSRAIACRYRRRGAEVGFELGPRDDSREVLIDPVFATWSGYLGGGGEDDGESVAIAANGDAIVSGSTSSVDFPNHLGLTTAYGGGQDGFVMRINPLAGAVVWSTFLGGKAEDDATSVAIEPAGQIAVAGTTFSPDFPSTVPSRAYDGGIFSDAFVTRLPPSGDALLFSTTLGGPQEEDGVSVTTDSDSIWVGGNSRSSSFAGVTSMPMQAKNGGQDVFVAQLFDDAGTGFFTWFGGSATDSLTALKVDAAGRLYLVGNTVSGTQFVLHPVLDGGSGQDGFVAIIDTNPPAKLAFATTLGGSGLDSVNAIALRADGDFYVGGNVYDAQDWLHSTVLFPPTQNFDGFVARIGAGGQSLKWIGVIGGTDAVVSAVGVDARGNLDFAASGGGNLSANITPSAIQAVGPPKKNGFFGVIDPDAREFVYLSYLGGSGVDVLRGLANFDGGVVLVGSTDSGDFVGAAGPLHGDGGTNDATLTTVFFPPPSVSQGLNPDTGPYQGGTSVTLTGDIFLPDASVTFGGNAATVVASSDQTLLTVLTPPGSPGPVDVVVTNMDGQSVRLPNAFTYTGQLPPSVSLTPPSQNVDPKATAMLDGTGSTGVAPLAFKWEQSAGPTAGTLTPNGATATFAASVAGDYGIKLTVTDGSGASSSAMATVHVNGNPAAVPQFKPGCGCSTFDAGGLVVLLGVALGRRARRLFRAASL